MHGQTLLQVFVVALCASLGYVTGLCSSHDPWNESLHYHYYGSAVGKGEGPVCKDCCKDLSHKPQSIRVWDSSTSRTYYSCQCEEIDKCQKPSGDDCAWYLSCLNKYSKTPATSGSGAYATDYAYHYCTRYGDSQDKFSADGQRWIAKTRKCLQDALTDYVASDVDEDTLKDIAFDSHVACYVDSGLCTLPPEDYVSISTTIGDAFLKQFSKTLGQAGSSALRCSPEWTARILRSVKEDVVTLGNKVKQAVVDTANKAKQAVVDTANKAKQAVVDAVVDTVVDPLKDAVDEKVEELKKAFYSPIPVIGADPINPIQIN